MNQKSSVILINPPYSLHERSAGAGANYPMGILCVASALEHAGFDVTVIDCAGTCDYNEKIIACAQHALFVGFSIMTNQIACALETAALLRTHYPTLPLVWGGIHPTLDPMTTAKSSLCDIVVRGEADETIVILAQALQERTSLDTVPGIVFKKGDDYITTPSAPIITDLDKLPELNYDFINVAHYLDVDYDKQWGFFPNEAGSVRRLTLHTARGCPFRCSFCINSLIRGDEMGQHRYRTRSVDTVLADIKRYHALYNINFISFGDDLFFAHKQRTIELIEKIQEQHLDIKWYANVRADYFNEKYLNYDLLKKVRAAGCIRFAIGVESGSQRILSYLNKQLDPKQVLYAALMINQFDFVAGYSFMTGLPGEEDEDVYRTMALIYMISKLHSRSYIIGPQLYRPYPGSKLFEDCISLGWKRPKTLEDYAADLELTGNMAVDKMVWIKNKKLAYDASQMLLRIERKTAELYLRKNCPQILDEFELLAKEVQQEFNQQNAQHERSLH